MRRVRRLGPIVAAVLVASCGGEAPPASPAAVSTAAVTTMPTTASSSNRASTSGGAESACAETGAVCAGPLRAGDHATTVFDHPFTFTVGHGWRNVVDTDRAFVLHHAARPGSAVSVWSHAAPAEQTPDGSAAKDAGFDTTIAGWLRFLRTRPGLEIGEPVRLELGDRVATTVEVTMTDEAERADLAAVDPVMLVTDTGTPPARLEVIGPTRQASMTLVEFGTDTIVIWVEAPRGEAFTDLMGAARPVIGSIRFLPRPPGSAAS